MPHTAQLTCKLQTGVAVVLCCFALCITAGRLKLVDLAGSERVKSTGISLADGQRMDEAKNINSSLSAFGKVVLALTSGSNQHVPYRDSKLTRILQGSVGGNCKTTMITTIGPAPASYAESVSSLLFATRAKKIKNYAVVNQEVTDQAMLAEYQKEIIRLRQQLEENQARLAAPPGRDDDADTVATLKRRATQLESKARAKSATLREREQMIEAERKCGRPLLIPPSFTRTRTHAHTHIRAHTHTHTHTRTHLPNTKPTTTTASCLAL